MTAEIKTNGLNKEFYWTNDNLVPVGEQSIGEGQKYLIKVQSSKHLLISNRGHTSLSRTQIKV